MVAGAIAIEVAKWGGEWLTTKFLTGLDDSRQRVMSPEWLQEAIAMAATSAENATPISEMCQRQGLLRIDQFVENFFASEAARFELHKPLQDAGKPDAAVLVAAFLAEAARHDKAQDLDEKLLGDWLATFAEAYFQETANCIRFRVARQDYCEQLRNAFDDVKFAGIAVEGQEIDRAEKLADIFVMPDVRQESSSQKSLEFQEQEAKVKEKYKSVPWQEDDREWRTVDVPWNLSDAQLGLLMEQELTSVHKKFLENRKPVSAKELLRQSKRAVLLGAPGSGKTTLMSFWAVMASGVEEAGVGAGRRLVHPYSGDDCGLPGDCLPILIRIRELAQHPEMTVLAFAQEFAQRELSVKALPQGFFEYWLENGQALILLDGLDEVADEAQRYKVVAKIEAFLGQYQENPAIITSRPSGYKRDFFRTEEYPHYELQPFDDGKIDEFIDHWYDSRFDLASERQRRKDSLRKALKAQPRIKRLARNPLLLTIIALIHRYQAKLPRERYKLYDKAVETLLTSWDANKELSNHEILEYLELDDLRRLMERLAYWIHSQGGTGDEEGGTLIDKDELIIQLTKYIREMKGVERHKAKAEAKRFLELVVRDRAGLLAQQGQDRYAFVHKTFQEYLTAMEIRDRQEEGFEVVLEHVEEHLHDPHWEEVLLLLIAQQKRRNPSKVLRAILQRETPYEKWLHRNLFFAAKCLAENVPVTESDLASSVIGRLVAFETSQAPQISWILRKRAFQLLTSLYETKFSDEVMKQLEEIEEITEWRLLKYQVNLQPEQSAIELLQMLKNNIGKVRAKASDYLAELREVPASVITALLEMLDDDDVEARYIAANSLGKISNTSSAVIPSLLEALNDSDKEMRSRVIASLIQLGHTSDKMSACLLELFKEKDFRTRIKIIFSVERSLVRLYNSPNGISITTFLELLENDNEEVRSRTATLLGQLGDTSEVVVNGLKKLLQDENLKVCSSATQSLIELDERSDEIIVSLNKLIKSKDSHVRYGAFRGLVKLDRNTNETAIQLLEAHAYVERLFEKAVGQ